MATPSTPCLIAFGGNVGDVPAHFRRALELLEAIGVVPLAISRCYVTHALLAPGGGPQPPYHNAVVRAHTDLDGTTLVARCHALGTSFGARPGGPGRRWQARALDVDVLARSDDRIDTESCRLPHPGLAYRPFVLWPLCDVAPNWQFGPHGRTAADYLARLAQPQAQCLRARLTWCGV